jgi:hypothetical protein
MQRQPRLSRTEVVARLRELAAQHGALSLRWIAAHDGQVLRSLRLHFPTFALACRAARVEIARPVRRARARPGPNAAWSKDQVADELRRLDGDGASTGWAELMEGQRASLVRAAAAHAGGLVKARAAARVAAPGRRPPAPQWDRPAIVAAIQARLRGGETLASSRAPQRLVAAARWHFASWEAALEAAGVDPGAVRLQRGRYTRDDIIAVIRRMARDGIAVRSSTLRARLKVDSVRKLFGSVDAAVRAAGIEQVVRHGNQRWTRDSVIAELQARAARGEPTLSRGLQRAVQLYFGGAPAARAAAGLRPLLRVAWTQQSLVQELQRRGRRGDSGHTLWRACKRLFGSVEAARQAAEVPAQQREPGMAAWDGRALLAELRRRLREHRPLGRGLTEGLRREFGSLAVARQLAERPRRRRGGDAASGRGPRTGRARGTRGERSAVGAFGSRAAVIEQLRAWHAAGGGPLDDVLAEACKRQFGSLVRACAEAGVAMAREWSAKRLRQALRDPRTDLADPELVAACIQHFGSVTAARAAVLRGEGRRAWSRPTVIAELQARARRGLKGVGRLLRDPAIRLFGSTEAALAAAHAAPRAARPSRKPS